MLENEQKHWDRLLGNHTQYGPYYCDKSGKYIDVDDAANPKYIPHIKFWSEDGTGSARTFVYNLATEDFYECARNTPYPLWEVWEISREDIPDFIIEEIFKKVPNIYNAIEIGKFSKFAMPIINKTFPALLHQNLVSVQPITGPIGGLAFYKPRYGVSKGKAKKTK